MTENIDQANEWYEKGCNQKNSGLYDDAIKSFEKAIEYDPKNALYWFSKGDVEMTRNKNDEALESFEKAIEYDPKNGRYWAWKGDVLMQRFEKYDEALQSYDKAIEYDQTNHLAWSSKGEISAIQKNYDDALNNYKKAIECATDDLERTKRQMYEVSKGQDTIIWSTVHIHDNWCSKGDVEMMLKKYDDALQSYDKAIEYDPENPRYWLNKSYAEKSLGKTVDATKSYKIAETLDVKRNLNVTKDSEWEDNQ